MVADRSEDEEEGSRVRLQYMKRRKVMLLWASERATEPIEVPRAALLEALGDDDVRADGSPDRYLLVAGIPNRSDGAGEPRPFVATFEHEAEARAAFKSLRLRAQPRTAWAQIVSISSKGRPRTVCWFGTESPHPPAADGPGRATAGQPETPHAGAKPAVRRWRTWPRRRRLEPSVPPEAPGSFGEGAAPWAPPPTRHGRNATRREQR
jgi:hypothetical protein